MKSIISITISILLFHSMAIGQNGFSISPESFDESINEDLEYWSSFRLEATMENNSDSILTINWQIINIDLPPEWGASVGDGNITSLPGPPIATNNQYPIELAPGSTNNNYFDIDIYPNETPGCGTFEVLFSLDESGLLLDTVEYEVSINDDDCLISKIDDQYVDEKIEIFPNPFMDHFNIKTKLDIKHVTIYNLVGIPLTAPINNFQNIDVSNLETGMYLLEIVFEDDHKLTKKVIHQK